MARYDWFADAFGASATDIRQKLVEEAWFGRTVTPRPRGGHGRDAEDGPMAERLGWDRVLHEKLYPDRNADKAFLQSLEAEHVASSDSHQHERGIDR